MAENNVNFTITNQEILDLCKALTAITIALASMLNIVVDLLNAIIKTIPQLSLNLSSSSGLMNGISSNLIHPLKKLIECLIKKLCKCEDVKHVDFDPFDCENPCHKECPISEEKNKNKKKDK